MIIEVEFGKQVTLGRLGENEARTFEFDISDMANEFPGATYSLLNMRPCDMAAYPVNHQYYRIENGYLYWTVTNADLSCRGHGECQIVCMQDNVIRKSEIYSTFIADALDNSEDPPEPWESWVQEVEEAAQRAEDAVSEIKGITATAETLEPGSPATANYEDGVLTFGIPKGDKGEQGEQGEKGDPGLESRLSAENISGNDYRLYLERV